MTTQAIYIVLSGPGVSRRFYLAAATDAQYNEATSETGTLSLGKVLPPGTLIDRAFFEQAAGIGSARVRNTQTNAVKCRFIPDQVGEGKTRYLATPFQVEEQDIIEAYVDVV